MVWEACSTSIGRVTLLKIIIILLRYEFNKVTMNKVDPVKPFVKFKYFHNNMNYAHFTGISYCARYSRSAVNFRNSMAQ